MNGFEMTYGDGRSEEIFKDFNALAKRTFNIDFAKWRELGFWTERFSHLAFLEKGKLASNVSASRIGLIANGRRIETCMIGTVMTDEPYRGRGLATELIQETIRRHANLGCELFILGAGQARRSFYERLGFKAARQTRFSAKLAPSSSRRKVCKLDFLDKADLTLFRRILKSYAPQPEMFSVADAQHIFAFSALHMLSDRIFHIPELDAIASFSSKDDALNLHGFISPRKTELKGILEAIAPTGAGKVEFGFTPDVCEGLEIERKRESLEEGDLLLCKGAASLLPESFKFPGMFTA